jgi:multiple sugar transport system permease protein
MVVAIPQLIFAFVLAVFVNGKFRGLNLFKSILIIPYLLNGVIVSTIFIIFFNNSGTLNTILEAIGLTGLKRQWLQSLKLVNPSIASISIWRYYGMNFIMFFGGLQTVPAELYEAAAVDGCSKWKEIRYISIPSIRNILFINILLSISGSIQVFEIPYIMMNGSNGTVTPVIQIQQSAFSDNRVGFAAALSIMVFIIVVIAVGLQSIVNKRGEEDFA